ncbi:hypothetical protein IW262DRAFT_1300293 [Armillaria fumosa]|nr:hypothetical protein IW262DRAFT_1300293 [Armillaria fumosa]
MRKYYGGCDNLRDVRDHFGGSHLRHSPTLASYGKRGPEQINVEFHNLRFILNLKVLELPRELADDLFDLPFPSLKELSLLGYTSDPGQLHRALARALVPVSHSRKLQIETVSNAGFALRSQMSPALTRDNIQNENDPDESCSKRSFLQSYPEPFSLPSNDASRIPVRDITSCYADKYDLLVCSRTSEA